jgi:hypothetical protein
MAAQALISTLEPLDVLLLGGCLTSGSICLSSLGTSGLGFA